MKTVFAVVILLSSLQMFAQTNHPGFPKKSSLDTVMLKDPADATVTIFKVTDTTGAIREYGKLIGGKKEGVWRTYFDNHFLYTLDEYHGGLKNGFSMMLASDGRVMKEEYYKNDVLDGHARTFSRENKIKIEENYVNGIVCGTKQIFYPDGRIQEEGNFNAQGIRDGVNRWYYNNGNLLVEYTYTNGDINGASRSFYENGKPKAEGIMKNDMENGYWKEYSDSGIIKAEGNYIEGKKTGLWKLYDENGVLNKTQTYKDGTMLDEKTAKKK